MTVFNTGKYVAEAIESILNQTFSNFEFIIIDDASTDDSRAIIDRYTDPRIIKVFNECNVGASNSSNIGLRLARAPYIARMDSDDVSLPMRFEKQHAYMESHPDVAVLGSWIQLTGAENAIRMYSSDPAYNEAVQIFQPSVAHPAIIMRRSVMDQYRISYNPDFPSAIDYEIYSRFPSTAKFVNLQEVLCVYRVHATQMSTARFKEQQRHADLVRARHLDKLGIQFDEHNVDLHSEISKRRLAGDITRLQEAHDWLMRISESNMTIRAFDVYALERVLSDYWYAVCHRMSHLGWRVWEVFHESPLSKGMAMPEEQLDAKRLMKTLALQGVSRIAVFGTGKMGAYLTHLCQANSIEVFCYLDNNSDIHGDKMDGVTIFPVAALRNEPNHLYILNSIVGDHDQAIAKQIRETLGDFVTVINWKDYLRDA